MYTAKLSLFTLVLLLLEILLTAVQGAPVESLWNSRYQNSQKNKKNVIVYRRYIRRRPSYYPDDLYMDEYVEIFHTRLRPPTHWLSDEEVDRIIRCDFDPNLEECKQIPEPNATSTVVTLLKPPSVSTTTERTNLPEATAPEITTPDTTATTKRHIEDTTTRKPLTTTTTTDAAITTTTEYLPLLPDIPEEEIEETSENYPNSEYEVVAENNVNKNQSADFDDGNISDKEEDYEDEASEEEQIENGL